MGSALGEGSSVEEAEEKALNRLMTRLNGNDGINQAQIVHIKKENASKVKMNSAKITDNTNIQSKELTNEKVELSNATEEEVTPHDWSDELSIIDLELKRLGWDREKENEFLAEQFKYRNRHSITNYKRLKEYINKLKTMDVDVNKPQDHSLERKQALEESNVLLVKLNWDVTIARDFLMTIFKSNTRKDLSLDELNKFNDLLKEKLIELEREEN